MNRVPPDSWFGLICTIDRSRQQRAAIRLTTMLTKQLELQFFSGTTSWALDLKATVRIPLAPPARVAGSPRSMRRFGLPNEAAVRFVAGFPQGVALGRFAGLAQLRNQITPRCSTLERADESSPRS